MGAIGLQQGQQRLEFVSRELQIERRQTDNRLPAIYRSMRRNRSNPALKNKRGPLAIKVGICALVAVCCLAMRFLPWQWVLDTRKAMNSLFTYDLEFDESLGRLKFVENLFPGVAAVFNTKQSLQFPVDGLLQSAYGADGQDHVVFKCEAGANVKAVSDGRVVKRGIHEQYGNYLMIEHAGNMISVYYGLKSSELEKGAEVKGGDVIGILTQNGELVFELRIFEKAQNPMRYLGVN